MGKKKQEARGYNFDREKTGAFGDSNKLPAVSLKSAAAAAAE